jgi:hypothetical protein
MRKTKEILTCSITKSDSLSHGSGTINNSNMYDSDFSITTFPPIIRRIHFQYKFETFFFLEKLNLNFKFHFCVKSEPKPKILLKNEELFNFGSDFTMALVFIHPKPTSNLGSMMLCIPTNNKMMKTRS